MNGEEGCMKLQEHPFGLSQRFGNGPPTFCVDIITLYWIITSIRVVYKVFLEKYFLWPFKCFFCQITILDKFNGYIFCQTITIFFSFECHSNSLSTLVWSPNFCYCLALVLIIMFASRNVVSIL